MEFQALKLPLGIMVYDGGGPLVHGAESGGLTEQGGFRLALGPGLSHYDLAVAWVYDPLHSSGRT